MSRRGSIRPDKHWGLFRSCSFERVCLVYVELTDLEKSHGFYNLALSFPSRYTVWHDTCWAANGHLIEKSSEPSIHRRMFLLFRHHAGGKLECVFLSLSLSPPSPLRLLNVPFRPSRDENTHLKPYRERCLESFPLLYHVL